MNILNHYHILTICELPRNLTLQGPHATQTYATPSSPQLGIAGQSGRGTSVVSTELFISTSLLYILYIINYNAISTII